MCVFLCVVVEIVVDWNVFDYGVLFVKFYRSFDIFGGFVFMNV